MSRSDEAPISSGLPAGWTTARLGEVIAADGIFTDGDWIESKDQDPRGDVRLVQLADIGDGEYRNRSARYLTSTKARELRCTFLEPGDLLVARMPEPLGRACIFPGDPKRSVTAVDVCIVRPGSGVDARWLLHFVNAPEFRVGMEEYERGTTRKRISRANLSQLLLPVPPEAEQRRIATKVDLLLGAVNAVRDRLAKVPPILKRLRQSVLAAAYSGRLTENWRDEHPEVHGTNINTGDRDGPWVRERAVDMCSLVQSGGTPKGRPFTAIGEVPFLKVYNIVNQAVCFEYKPQFIPRAVHQGELRRSVVRAGDVLMNIVGPPLGKVAVVPSAYLEWNINQALVAFRPSARIHARFLYYYLCEGSEIRAIESEYRGSAGQTNISLSQARDLRIPVPFMEEQLEIVRRLDAVMALADTIERRVAAATARADKLTQSILAKAFRGELVPTEAELARQEGREYEPAAVLLERIRNEQVASNEQAPTPNRKRRAKRQRGSAATKARRRASA